MMLNLALTLAMAPTASAFVPTMGRTLARSFRSSAVLRAVGDRLPGVKVDFLSKDDKQSKVPRMTKAPEPMKYFQLLRHYVAKDLYETFVVDHVFAMNEREVFDFLDHRYATFWLNDVDEDDSDEVEEQINKIIADKGTIIKDVEIDEFIGTGFAWREMGTVTSDEQATLTKFLNAWMIADGHPDDRRWPSG